MKTITASPSTTRRSTRRLWLPLAITAVSLVLLVALVDVRAVLADVRQSDWRYLAAASAALLAGMAMYALRWRLLLGGRPAWRDTLYAAGVGHALNILLPLRFGEPGRILVLGRTTRLSYSEITSSVVVERLWEQLLRLLSLGLAVAFGIGLQPSRAALAGTGAVLAALLAAVPLLLKHQAWLLKHAPRVLARVPRLDEARARAVLSRLLGGLALATRPERLAQGALCSLSSWALFGLFHALALLALPEALDTRQVITLALGALALAPPSAPTSPGVYHASLIVPLSLLGFAETTLTAYAVVLHALLMAWLVPLGLAGMLRSGVAPREVLPVAETTESK